MSGHQNCAVFGCVNSGARLKKWISIPCSLHECNQGTSSCDCAPPSTLFSFPTQLHDSERRQQWIKLVNRKDVVTTSQREDPQFKIPTLQ